MSEFYALLLTAFFIILGIMFFYLVFKLFFGHNYADDYRECLQGRYINTRDNSDVYAHVCINTEPMKNYATLEELYQDEDNLKRISEKYLYDISEPMTVRESEYLFRQNLSELMQQASNIQERGWPYIGQDNGQTVGSIKSHISDMVNDHKEQYGYADWNIDHMPERFDGTVEHSDDEWNGHKDYFFKDQEEYNQYYGLSNEDYKYEG